MSQFRFAFENIFFGSLIIIWLPCLADARKDGPIGFCDAIGPFNFKMA